MFDEYSLRMPFDIEGLKTIDKIHGFKLVVQQLLERTSEKKEMNNDSNIITCPDCQTYEASLQKLENDVRQHIRVCFVDNVASATIKDLPGHSR